mgnify:CR=1 FL=1
MTNNEEFEKILENIDENGPEPQEEPQRQYYFMKKCKEWAAEEEKRLGRKLTLSMQTMGCQMNARDSEKLEAILSYIGYETVEEPVADFVLYNTCTVRENANLKVYGRLGYMKNQKKKNPAMKIAMCGCMMQEPTVVEKIQKSYPFVDLVFGTHNVYKLAELLYTRIHSDRMVLDIWKEAEGIVEDLPSVRKYPFKAGVNIMYGCNNFCTYCIVPYVRGREKSRKPGDILAEFRGLVEAGYKEITLLGQNVNSYGKGLEEKVDFSDLLNLLCTVPGDYHIRFMTSHPKDASHKLIDTIAAQPKLCKHLHLPVQCGSDELLKKMNRHYTVEQYMELIEYARKTVPGITFSSDIIVGFPGETEADFVKTLELVQKVGYMQLFTFIYSKRTGTKAAEMPDPTPRKEKTDRMTRLLKVQDEIAMALVKAQVGQTVKVLVEGFGRNEGTLSGRLDNNLTVEFTADASLMGSYANVHLTGARATVLLGELA